jgi:hypothetical protein
MKGLNTTQASSFHAGDNPKSKIEVTSYQLAVISDQ